MRNGTGTAQKIVCRWVASISNEPASGAKAHLCGIGLPGLLPLRRMQSCYPVGHTCASSSDCALPFGAANGGQPVKCSRGTCGGYGAYCPVNTQNLDSVISWCSSGLACVDYQCALAASEAAQKRERPQQQMQTSLNRTWQQQQLDSIDSCGDGSIRCPTGGASGAFEVSQEHVWF